MATTVSFSVEVVYARADVQPLIRLQVPAGTTAQQAVERSGLLQQFPELEQQALKLGLFSKAITTDTVLREHDRVEIYRPLIADPKEIRRQRALEGKAMKKGA